MRSAETALKGKDTAPLAALYISFELGDKHWTMTISDGLRRPSRYTVAAGDKAAVLDRICKAKARCGLAAQAPVHSCYEAGRDGWWLHRWLREQGVHNIVVDSASIEINRRARRTKTDRLVRDAIPPKCSAHGGAERTLPEPGRAAFHVEHPGESPHRERSMSLQAMNRPSMPGPRADVRRAGTNPPWRCRAHAGMRVTPFCRSSVVSAGTSGGPGGTSRSTRANIRMALPPRPVISNISPPPAQKRYPCTVSAGRCTNVPGP